MFRPFTSTGPRAYLVPLSSQATKGLAGSFATCWALLRPSAVVQSVASQAFSTSAFSQARSLLSVGLGAAEAAADALADGVGLGVVAAVSPAPLAEEDTETLGSEDDPLTAAPTLGDPLADADGEPEAEPVGVAVGVPDGVGSGTGAPSSTSTARNSRAADRRIAFRVVSSMFLPGRETTMLFEPWVVISASATPEPSTRARMIFRASSIVAGVICPDWPGCGTAFSTNSVPPSRSRASFGVHWAVLQMTPPATRPYSRADRAPSTPRVRQGRE